jgi:(p)ppGpp synthase/HD superfamily hydrolase
MEFNAEIARMVNDVTEQDKSKPWFKRKMEALKHIKHMKHDSLLVKSADVLQNLTELNEDLKKEGILVFNKFNASKEETILRYTLLIPEIKSAWDGNPLVAELELGLAGLLEYNEKNDTTHNN